MESQHNTITSATSRMDSYHNLSANWTLWAHLPHNTDWSINGDHPVKAIIAKTVM